MRVFYPVSTKLAEFVNDDARAQPYWMTLWSIAFIALFVLLLPALHHFENGAKSSDFIAKQQNGKLYSKVNPRTRAKTIARGATDDTRLQEYIFAHRHEEYSSNPETMVTHRTIPFKAHDNLYL